MRIFLVEDHPIFRRGLRGLLEEEPDLEVCGEAEDVGSAWDGVVQTRPDLVVLDISLKGRNGLELVKSLSTWRRDLPVLVLSTYEESLYAERSLRAGARGYIMKHEAADRIVRAIREVLAGGVHVSGRVAAALLSKSVGETSAPTASPDERLSDRELEVFELFGKGMTTKEVSDRLSLSPKTVGTYRDRIREKLGLKSSAEFFCHAAQWLGQRPAPPESEEP